MVEKLDKFDRQALILIAISVLVGLWVIKVVRRAYFTPLRNIPGPWYAKFTHLWLKVHVLSGQRMHYIHDLHLKYGPIIRVSPEEIDISDTSAFKEIHRIGGRFLKSPWYHSFRKGETQDVFSLIGPREHGQRRKLFSPLFSNTSLMNNWASIIIDKVNATVKNIKREASDNADGQVDVYKWWTFMTADVISHLAFGQPFGMLDHGKKSEYMQKIEDASKFGLVTSELPLVRTMLEWIPSPSIQRQLDSDAEVLKMAMETLAKTSQTIGPSHIFSKIVAQKDQNVPKFSDYQLAYEAAGLIVAGSGTTAVSLTYPVWAVLSNPSVQAKLEEEVASLHEGYTDSQLENLPYLNAVIEETLRLYGAAPGSLPRTVPEGGATLRGHFIPAGITIGTQAYTYHRDPQVYNEPDKFVPERFIDSSSGGFQPQREGIFSPFGAGSRTCLGLHLARIELRHATTLFFRECKGARIAPHTTPDSMEMLNFFLISPRSGECWITLPKGDLHS